MKRDATPKRAIADGPQVYSGRDLSWLQFDERVLEVAEDAARPVLDRIRFLAISASNLDEFFMKRVALLRRRIQLEVERVTHDGRTVRQQYDAVVQRVKELQQRQIDCWVGSIVPQLNAAGIRMTDYAELPERQQRRVDRWFMEQVFPLLTPLAVDPGHPFPHISNLSLNFGVLVAGEDGESRFARLKMPDLVPGWVCVPSKGAIGTLAGASTPFRAVPMAQVIRNNLQAVFPGMSINDVMEFRLTRSVGLEEQEDDVDDLFEAVEAALRHRRFAEAVRLETEAAAAGQMVQLLLEELELDPTCHFGRSGPLDFTRLSEFGRIDRPDLRRPRWKPVTPPRLRQDGQSIFDVIRQGDLLVHHPYESFRASVERFISEAADDPDVVAIKQCLYRTDPDSPFIHSLLRAAESGKQVACLVELRARFDEDRNLQLTRLLEKHGVHVAWGVMGYKTHAKCSLVVRREGGGFRSYGHIGSGNYHPVTANHYCDFGLLTADEAITGDLTQLFNYLTGRSRHDDYRQLLVAPVTLRSQFEALIEAEIAHAKAGRPCGITAKMNQLEDRRMIELVMRASRAGVPIDLHVRGFCCLRPGIPGYTDNVRIRSIVGEFLEHARVYHFRNGKADPLEGHWYIGSADWMERNLSSRVEVITPVTDMRSRERLLRVMQAGREDGRNAWDMQPDGTWVRAHPSATAAEDSFERLGAFDGLCRDALAVEVDAIASGVPESAEEEAAPDAPPRRHVAEVDRMIGLVLLDEPWRTRSEVAARAGVSMAIASRAASRLEAAGLLIVHGTGRAALWQPTPMLADALGGPLPLSSMETTWVRQWLTRRVAAHVDRTGGEVRRQDDADLVTRAKDGEWTAWGMFDTLQGIKSRLQACLACDVDAIELIARDQAACQTLRRRVAKLATDPSRIRVRTMSRVIAETAPKA